MNRKNAKVSMNRQCLESPFFGVRKDKVKWPTFRKGYMTDENVAMIKKYATGKGRSIIFLDGQYETKLNRYVRKDPMERAIFFEFMVKEKGVKGAIFMYCWLGNFHNGSIVHFSYQFPQMNCWLDAGKQDANAFFERNAFKVYRDIAYMLYGSHDAIKDKEVKTFIENGNKLC